ARGVLKSVDQWIMFANKILALMHGLNKSIPASVEGIATALAGIFKGKGGANATGWGSLDTFFNGATKSIESGGAKAAAAAAKAAGAITGILGGIGTFMGTRHQGLATGVLGGAMAGATTGASIGMLFGPHG